MGTLTSPAGFSYQGEWKQDLPNGQGRYNYPDGSCYEGQVVDGRRQGWGIFVFPNGQRMEGEWENDAPKKTK